MGWKARVEADVAERLRRILRHVAQLGERRGPQGRKLVRCRRRLLRVRVRAQQSWSRYEGRWRVPWHRVSRCVVGLARGCRRMIDGRNCGRGARWGIEMSPVVAGDLPSKFPLHKLDSTWPAGLVGVGEVPANGGPSILSMCRDPACAQRILQAPSLSQLPLASDDDETLSDLRALRVPTYCYLSCPLIPLRNSKSVRHQIMSFSTPRCLLRRINFISRPTPRLQACMSGTCKLVGFSADRQVPTASAPIVITQHAWIRGLGEHTTSRGKVSST